MGSSRRRRPPRTAIISRNTRTYARGAFAGFVGDIVAFAGRRRLAGLALLAMLAAAAEGAGLLLLIPILHLLGLTGPAAGDGGAVGLDGALALYVVLVAAAALVLAARGIAVGAMRSDYGDDLRRRLHDALLRMEWRAYARLAGAEATHAMTGEVARAAQGVDFLLRAAGWAVEIPVLLAVALRLSPVLTAASLGLAAVCLLLARPLDRRVHALGREVGQASKALYGDLADDLAGMRVIRGLGVEAERARRFAGRMLAVRRSQAAHQRDAGLARAATQAVTALAAAMAVWFAVRVLALPLPDTLVLMIAFARLLSAGLRIQEAWRTVLHALPAHQAAMALLARCREAAEPDAAAEAPPALSEAIRLEGVAFRYGVDDPPALAGIDATIPARAVTALVGPSGAGKSTLADLLLGLIGPDQGRMLVDGRALDGPARRAWRRRAGMVPQDPFLFHDTIRANLAMAAPEASEDALWAALGRAAAADFVRALPGGLDTVVGDRGGLLSGGQRQRLALARALLPEPDLLILDEATSALDNEHERRVLEALDGLRGRLTVVIVAHRPSTARWADHVVALDAGRVVAEGRWAEVGVAAGPLLERLAMG